MRDGNGVGDLVKSLQALASQVRLDVLRAVRTPRTLREIVVESEAPRGPRGRRGRPLARQSVRAHIQRLVQAGVVVGRPTQRLTVPAVEYVVNHRALFQLAEEFRALADLEPSVDVDERTRIRSGPSDARRDGPGLLLVKGLHEGRWWSMGPADGGESHWIVGRRSGCAVRLDYDAFVSSENCLIERRAARFTVRDLPGSRNGTSLNFSSLTAEPQELRRGDVLGVGRTLLLFLA